MNADALCARDTDDSASGIGPAHWRGHGTLLVVDDDIGIRSVLQFVFERCGFSVLTAADGSSALEILRRAANEIRLVFLDLVLPDTDGDAVFRVMRQICPGLPAILCSGYLDENDVKRRVGTGWTAVIRKPFRLDAVMQTVQTLLG